MTEKFQKIPSIKDPSSPESIEAFTLFLGDNALILGHRNSEWCGHGPVLEQDIAITNISLDLIGQARNYYQYAATLRGDGSTEDEFAYLRDPEQFQNFVLLEIPRGDWAFTILRQFFFSNYQFSLYQQLEKHADAQLAAIAVKSLKEVTYHLRWSSEWVIRLGDGTGESRERMLKAIEDILPYTGEFFKKQPFENVAGLDLALLKNNWDRKVNDVFSTATLPVPGNMTTHKAGKHTEHLTELLAEMQVLPRTYPGAIW